MRRHHGDEKAKGARGRFGEIGAAGEEEEHKGQEDVPR
jgi:hypothetical protein